MRATWSPDRASHQGVSMEELVRRLIHERREKSESHTKPSEAFRRYFGPEHGVELPLQDRHGYRPLVFPGASRVVAS